MGTTTISMTELKQKYAGENSKFIEVQGMKIHYRDQGKGPVLVLLHGVCASLHTWDGWVDELKDHYRIIRLDIPGFGLTGPAKDSKSYTRDGSVWMVNEFVKALNLKKFHIAGNSLGGYIAWNYTLEYPKKVNKLILIDSVGYKQTMPWLLKVASNPVLRPMVRHMMPRYFMHQAVEEVFGDKSKVTDKLKDRYFELAMREGNTGSYVDVFTIMRELSDKEEISTGIKNIQHPTLVMWGGKDEWIPYKYFKNWKKDIPNGLFITYTNAGHTPMEEIPAMTAGDAHKFLSGKIGPDAIEPSPKEPEKTKPSVKVIGKLK
ncbi:MAG: alpha/beta hydrolase [bacterium]|nr:alpha/beta hydrolase [bacterium]